MIWVLAAALPVALALFLLGFVVAIGGDRPRPAALLLCIPLLLVVFGGVSLDNQRANEEVRECVAAGGIPDRDYGRVHCREIP